MPSDPCHPQYRVFPDYRADPVWGHDGDVDLDTLPITQEMRDRLRAWSGEWELLAGALEGRYEIVDHEAHRRWKLEGRRLANQLQSELGSDAVVRYEP